MKGRCGYVLPHRCWSSAGGTKTWHLSSDRRVSWSERSLCLYRQRNHPCEYHWALEHFLLTSGKLHLPGSVALAVCWLQPIHQGSSLWPSPPSGPGGSEACTQTTGLQGFIHSRKLVTQQAVLLQWSYLCPIPFVHWPKSHLGHDLKKLLKKVQKQNKKKA